MNLRQLNPPGGLRLALLAGLCLCLVACAAATPTATPEAATADQVITDVTAGRQEDVTMVSVGVSSPPVDFYAFQEETVPPRVVIEMPEVGPGPDPEPLIVNDGLVSAISWAAAEIKGGEGTRLEIGLTQAADYEVERQEGRLLISLASQAPAATAPEAALSEAALGEPSPGEVALSEAAPAEAAPGEAAPSEAVLSEAAPAEAAPGEELILEGTSRTPAEAEAAPPRAEAASEKAEAVPAEGEAPSPAQEGLSMEAADSAPGSPCRIQAIEFNCLPGGKCVVRVATTARPGYELARISRDTLLLTLQEAKLPQELSRPLDTGQFEQAAVDDVSPKQSGENVVIAMRFREVVPYHLVQNEDNVVLEFESARARPNPQIKLAGRQPEETPAEPAVEQAPDRSPESLEEVLAPPKVTPAAAVEEPQATPGAVKVIYPGMQRHFTGQRISLDFQNADVHNVLRLIAEVSGLNVITSDDVKGRITMRLVKIPWDQALDIVLASCNLAMSRTGNVVRVASASRFREEQKQAEEAAQTALDALRKKEQLEPLMTEKIRVNYAKADQMKDRVTDILSARGRVSFDERTNIVIVRDIPESVTAARELIESLDWPTPQVMIEARIVEATSTFSRELGTQWGVQFQKSYGAIDGTVGVEGRSGNTGVPSGVPFIVNLPTTTTFGGLGFTFSKLSGSLNVDARLLASEQQGKLRIISAPKIATLDNTEAYIQQGEDIPYLAQSVDGISTQFVQTALKLTVTPHITPDGRVRMKIRAEKSEPSDREIQGTPGILRKETQTEVLVDHGETVVIGGILKDTNRYAENRIPFLHRIPILGWLFKSQLKDEEKQELLIFITPKIVSMEKAHQMI